MTLALAKQKKLLDYVVYTSKVSDLQDKLATTVND